MRRRWSAISGPLILLLIVVGGFWKLLTKQFTWMDQPDMAYQVLPWYQFQAASWHRGSFPLWDPHVWGGQPLIGQLQPGAAYPLNWPIFLLFPFKVGHLPSTSVTISFILSHFLAALFCYWLCRDLKLSRAASIFAGAVFALSGVVGNLGLAANVERRDLAAAGFAVLFALGARPAAARQRGVLRNFSGRFVPERTSSNSDVYRADGRNFVGG